jgi:hypothetical protein
MIFDTNRMSVDRRNLAWLAAVVFILCFVFAPVTNG